MSKGRHEKVTREEQRLRVEAEEDEARRQRDIEADWTEEEDGNSGGSGTGL